MQKFIPNRARVMVFLLGLSLLLRPVGVSGYQPEALTPDPLIQAMLQQVNSSTLSAYVGYLTGVQAVSVGGSLYTFSTRYSRAEEPCRKATQYAWEHFQSLGLPVQYHEYTLPLSGMRRNVIAEQTGSLHPERIYILCAHLDSISSQPYTLAPGADDNASGSAAVFLAADILSHYRLSCTLRYVLFTGEEQGLYGSQAYAAYVSSREEDVRGVLNLDMVAFNSIGSPIMELHTRSGETADSVLSSLFVDAIQAYGLNLVPQVVPDNEPASDHASFWNYGYPAILAIEDYEDYSVYYHTVGDTLNTLDMVYFTDFTKAVLSTTAHLVGLLPPEPQSYKIYIPVILQ